MPSKYHKEHYVDSNEEFGEEQAKEVRKVKEQAHEVIEKLEGTVVIISLNYDPKDHEPNDADIFVAICGGVHDIVAIDRTLSKARLDIIEDVLPSLSKKDQAHVAEDIILNMKDHNER